MPGEQHPFDLEPGAPAPGVGDGAPQGAAPASPPQKEDDIRSTVESLKPLTIFAEALKDPEVQKRVISAFTGAGAPPRDPSVPQGPSIADQEAKIRASYTERRKAAMAVGDFDTAFDLSAEMGAELSTLRNRAEFQASAGPIVNMTARNTVESWIASKTATSPLFAKLADKFRIELNKTNPNDLATLATQGNLLNACELVWNKVVSENYESAYNKNVPTVPAAQQPPNYSMGGAGGAPPREQVPDGDEDDDRKFQELAEKAGVNFSVDPKTGAIMGEMR